MDLMSTHPAMLAALVVALFASITDLKDRTVPNALVLAGAAAGLALNVWVGGGVGAARSLIGAVTGFLVFLPFFLLGGMGGGDVKLMGALGACLGAIAILQTAVVASFAGAALALVVASRHGVLGRTLSNTGQLLGSWLSKGPRAVPELSLESSEALSIPYALPIAAGALFIVLSRS